MLVIMSTQDIPWYEDDNGMLLIDSFSQLDSWEDISCFVFHSSRDDDKSSAMSLSGLSAYVEKLIYVYEDMNSLLYFLFRGIGADIYDSLDFLMDQDTFSFITENYKSSQMTVKSPEEDVSVLVKGISNLMTHSPEDIQKMAANKNWLRTLGTAAASVDKMVTDVGGYSSNVVELLKQAKSMIDQLDLNNINLSKEISGIRQTLAEQDNYKDDKENSLHIYPSYTVPDFVQKVIYVRGVGPTMMLNTLLRFYVEYLNTDKDVSAKLLLVYPGTKNNKKRYESFKRLDRDSLSFISMSASDVYITYDPKKAILDKFFEQEKAEVFIVYDMMQGSDLITGKKVIKMYGVSGASDRDKFKMEQNMVFSPIVARRGNLHLQWWPGYAQVSEVQRKSQYYTQYSNSIYQRLNEILKIED